MFEPSKPVATLLVLIETVLYKCLVRPDFERKPDKQVYSYSNCIMSPSLVKSTCVNVRSGAAFYTATLQRSESLS